ncbi:MAG: tyrosine-type recombinase/integrase [Peptococcaceae bacterium]|nr:tyrosine-type recombinase/integrase [Peptococcaceae bacterium]
MKVALTNDNATNNILGQFQKTINHCNQGSIKTQARYIDAFRSFLIATVAKYRIRDIKNIQQKHVDSFVSNKLEQGISAKTIKTDLSGIRFWHDQISAAKYQLDRGLAGNQKYHLDKTPQGGVARAWTQSQYEAMKDTAHKLDRENVSAAFVLVRYDGLRVHEITRIDYATAKKAVDTGTLHIIGKGGKERDIPLSEQGKSVLIEAMGKAKPGQKLFISKGQKTHQAIKAVQDFIRRHRGQIEGGLGTRKKITIHGLRHLFAQGLYHKLRKEGYSDKEARLLVSQRLGHERDEVTEIYLFKED